MSVSPLRCVLSLWEGDQNRCRVCNQPNSGDNPKYCEDNCKSYWLGNHRYKQARLNAIRLSKLACLCRGFPHPVCAMCNRCEPDFLEMGRLLTVDHIKPRNGRTAQFSCMHHVSNLQVLCGGTVDSCHEKKTREEDMSGKRLRTSK